jgi:hypothetical protein
MTTFVEQVSRLKKDQECTLCGQDGNEPNPQCGAHSAWDMPNDDAVETLHDLISQARAMTEGTVPEMGSPEHLAQVAAVFTPKGASE